jgi:single-stranded-DNA-specific exonuclease
VSLGPSALILTPLESNASRLAPVWRVRPPAPPHVVTQLCRDLDIPPLLASVLWGRGLREDALDALQPPLEPSAIPDLSRAAERLELALRSGRRIVIHGDYDADGISGTAVLTLGLRALGGNVTPFIPNRLTDGYGISPYRVEEHIACADLFITVDCGITNLSEIKRLQEAGVEVIVTDHHHPGQALPECLVVHPSLSPYAKRGLPELTGAGVAYHLLWALHERLGLEPPLEYTDIASIGTIADVALLMGENRALVQAGLERLRDSKWPGLRATIAQTLSSGAPTARDVAFVLAPRLNAAGRLGEADKGLELLTTASERRARELAAYLDARNNDRRKIQDEMLAIALQKVDTHAPALVLEDPGWHPGVMGIVASKVLERFYKPVFIIAKGKGSVRSTPGISAVQALTHAAEHLVRYGGHSQAAGFAIRDEHVGAFRDSICEFVAGFPAPRPEVTADALLCAREVDKALLEALETLEPYGQGHPSPVFALTDRLDGARAVGQGGNHLQLRVAGVKGVSWGKGCYAPQLPSGCTVNTAVSLRENEWQGKKSVEFVADEVRHAEPLGFTDEKEDEHPTEATSPAALTCITRGRPHELTNVRVYPGGPDNPARWTPGDPPPERLRLRELPLQMDALLELTSSLETLVKARTHLYFDLSPVVVSELETLALQYPGVHELRQAFVCLQRHQALPFTGVTAELCRAVLQELGLLDAHGRALRGQKRDPYSSDTFLRGQVERYKLLTFVKAYRYLNDASFARATLTLFGNASGAVVP